MLFLFFYWFFEIFFLLFKNSCLHLPPTTPRPSHPSLPPRLPLPLGFVHVSFIVVPGNPSHLPSGYSQTVLNFNLLILKKEKGGREREGHTHTHTHTSQFVVPLIYAFTGCFLYVSWLGIEPATLVYGDNAITKWTTRPGKMLFLPLLLLLKILFIYF